MPVYMFANRPGCEPTSPGRKGLNVDHARFFPPRDNRRLGVQGAQSDLMWLTHLFFFQTSSFVCYNAKYLKYDHKYVLE